MGLPYRTPPRTPYGVARRLFQVGTKVATRAALRAAVRRIAGTSTSTAAKSAKTNYVTTQHDTARQYRYKRMPRRKRKRWVKKIKQNAAMDYAMAGTRTAVYNGSLSKSIRTGQTQGVLAVHLYGLNGGLPPINGTTNEFATSDINYLISRDDSILTTGQKLSKFRFTSAVIDITVRNSSENNLGLEVDLYVIKYGSETDSASFMTLHETAINQLNGVDGPPATPPLTLEKRGVTPFDIPAMAAMGMKIMSKQKFFLPNGDTFTYQYRDPRNHAFGLGTNYDNDGYTIPYQTVTLLCIFKPIVGGTTADANLTMGATRTYRYGIIGQNQLAGDSLIA